MFFLFILKILNVELLLKMVKFQMIELLVLQKKQAKLCILLIFWMEKKNDMNMLKVNKKI